jgi:hypothetical protein
MQLSKNVTLDKAIFSNTAIRKGLDNTPNATQINNMKNVCKVVIEPLIERFGVNNTHINSFFRSEKVNRAVGGSSTSQHRFGEAVDIDGLNDVDNMDIAKWAVKNINFDQIIFEFKQSNGDWAWIHISTKIDTLKNRHIILEAKKDADNKTFYEDITKKYL